MTSGPTRISLRQLDSFDPDQTEASYATIGRVVSFDDARILLADAHTARAFERPRALEFQLGDWLELRISKGDSGYHTLDGRRLGVCRSENFPNAQGDWQRLQANARRGIRNLHARARIMREIRRYFDDADFLEVETPTLVPSPGLDLHLDAFKVQGLGRETWLLTSPEYQMKRLLSAGLDRIYQLGRSYRRDEVGHHHQPEFTMLEWYRMPGDSESVMRDTEVMTEQIARALHGRPYIPGRGREIHVQAPWPRLRISEAFERYASRSLERCLQDESVFFQTLIEEIEPHLGFPKPVFLTHWPASMASLARLCPEDERWADRFEAYVDGLELCNGFGELTDSLEQRRRLEADQHARQVSQRDVYPLDEAFLSALEEGIAPSGGNALGVDRLVMLMLGANHIQEVLAIPHEEM